MLVWSLYIFYFLETDSNEFLWEPAERWLKPGAEFARDLGQDAKPSHSSSQDDEVPAADDLDLHGATFTLAFVYHTYASSSRVVSEMRVNTASTLICAMGPACSEDI